MISCQEARGRSSSVGRKDVPPNVEKEHLETVIDRLQRRVLSLEGKAPKRDVIIQVGSWACSVSTQADIPPARKSVVDVMKQHDDCERNNMRKRIEELTVGLKKQEVHFHNETQQATKQLEEKDRLITQLKQALAKLQSTQADIPPARKSVVDVMTQHDDCERTNMRKRIKDLTAGLKNQDVRFLNETKKATEQLQEKDRLITQLKQELAKLQSTQSSLRSDSQKLISLRAQLDQMTVENERLNATVKALKKPAERTRSHRVAEIDTQTEETGVSAKNIARWTRQIMMSALGMSVLPNDFILSLADVEKVCRTEKESGAVWRAWWPRIVDAMSALKEGGHWKQNWFPLIVAFAEGASAHVERRSDKITAIMEAFWKGEERMIGSEEEVKALFKTSPILAITCWGTHPESPWLGFQEACSNLLTAVPPTVYFHCSRKIGGYALNELVERSILAKNLETALKHLHRKNEPGVHDLVISKSWMNPCALLKWGEIQLEAAKSALN